MIGLKEFMVNEVSSDLLMKAAKKAKEVGDPRAQKFFNAAMDRAKKEFDDMSVDAQKQAQSQSKKVFNTVKKLGTPMFGFGSGGSDTLTFEKDERDGYLIIQSDGHGIFPTKATVGDIKELASKYALEHVSDKLESKLSEMEDGDPVIFAQIMIAADDKTKKMEVFRNCNYLACILLPSINYVIAGMYVEYRPDGKDHPAETDVDVYKLKDKRITSFIGDFMKVFGK